MLAVLSGESVVSLIITLVIVGLIYWVLSWGLQRFALPEPFAKIANVLLILLVVVFVVNALLSLMGHPIIRWG